GANRLGASALMQGLADGYFVIPYTIGNYLASTTLEKTDISHQSFKQVETETSDRVKKLLSIKGKRTVDSIHRELGRLVWDECGMARSAEGLKRGLEKIPAIKEEFWQNINVLGDGEEFNQSLEKAGRVADFLELAELMFMDALTREESCGGHFRTEYQNAEGEAMRNDEDFSHAAVWDYQGEGKKPLRHKEELSFEYVHLAQRSYK
ncbi:MAG: succinate dehydrogenase flavoprotein subunit, partial [bacterium]